MNSQANALLRTSQAVRESAHWSASGVFHPDPAQWADSRTSWREGMLPTLTLRLIAMHLL